MTLEAASRNWFAMPRVVVTTASYAWIFMSFVLVFFRGPSQFLSSLSNKKKRGDCAVAIGCLLATVSLSLAFGLFSSGTPLPETVTSILLWLSIIIGVLSLVAFLGVWLD